MGTRPSKPRHSISVARAAPASSGNNVARWGGPLSLSSYRSLKGGEAACGAPSPRRARCFERSGRGDEPPRRHPDHQAESPLEAEDSPAGAAVDVVDATSDEFAGTLDIVAVITVAAVDDDVPGVQVRGELLHGAAGHPSRHHQPEDARLGELRREVRALFPESWSALQLTACGAVRRMSGRQDSNLVGADNPIRVRCAGPAPAERASVRIDTWSCPCATGCCVASWS